MRTIEDCVLAVGRIPVVPTILEVMARSTGMRFTAVARVTDQTWTACAVRDEIEFGLRPGSELKLETTVCNEIRQHGQAVIFGSASESAAYCKHPTPKMYGFESYISIPIVRADGEFFGTLCAIDPKPARLDDPNLMRTLELFAQLIALHLDAFDQLEHRTRDLAVAHEATRLQDQFVAVLGHDLRNPLNAISISAQALEWTDDRSRIMELSRSIKRGCKRMSGLIEDILDLARDKLGGGIPVHLAPAQDLGAELRQVASEIGATHANRKLDVSIAIDRVVVCDAPRLAQLFSNLLLNAMMHGSAEQPVVAIARSDDQGLKISVRNGGACIPTAVMGRLFEPFSHGDTQSPSRGPGLGLGLFIAASIAKAHSGTIEVTSSTESGTLFCFSMPCGAA